MNYNYDYGNYMVGNNSYPTEYGYNNMNYKGNKANVTFMNSDNSTIKNDSITKENQQIVDPYIGLIRGNLFNNLYAPYKNYTPIDIVVTNERESLLGQIQMYNFATIELNLYLDLYPNDRRAVQLFKNYVKATLELCAEYNKKYGPLTVMENMGNDFEWVNSPWPWEVSK